MSAALVTAAVLSLAGQALSLILGYTVRTDADVLRELLDAIAEWALALPRSTFD